MSRLFTGLPAPAGSRQEVEPEEHEEMAEPSNKRQKVDTNDQAVAPTQAAFSFADPVVAALVKITTHISSSKKFNRASELLRQLIVEDKIGQEHSKVVFEVHKCLDLVACSVSAFHTMLWCITHVFSSLDACLPHAQALKASLQHPDNAEDPQLRREYLKLFTIASKVAEVSVICALHTLCCLSRPVHVALLV